MGINVFLLGLSNDLYARCQRLIHYSEITSPYQELSSLSTDVCEKLRGLQQQIIDLKSGDTIRDERFWKNAYDEYQYLCREVALLEQFAVPVLIRYNETDHLQGQLIAELASEIGYPHELLPIATTTSDQYYWARPELRIIAMPTGDVGGILGWPDLVHEMAHILLEAWPDFLRPFKSIVKQHFQKKRQSIRDLNSSESDNKWLAEARIKWGDRREGMWQIEMAANLISTFVFGPSFGWQHIRLSINHSHNPYMPSPGDPLEDHPADQAQLDCISEMLGLMGLQDESDNLQSRWDEIVSVSRAERPQGYSLYYPPELLKGIAETVFAGCIAQGLIPFTDHQKDGQYAVIVHLVDQAWHQFRTSSKDYSTWETLALTNLKQHLIKAL